MSQWFIPTSCEFIITVNIGGGVVLVTTHLCAYIIHEVYTEGKNHSPNPWDQEEVRDWSNSVLLFLEERWIPVQNIRLRFTDSQAEQKVDLIWF